MKEDNMIKEQSYSNYGMGSGTKIENQDIFSLRKKILNMLGKFFSKGNFRYNYGGI